MTKENSLLIVEDEPAIRTGLVDVFVYHGYQVEFAEDGAVGLDKALSGDFDLIILDVMLPSLNGFDICRSIREKDKDQPIIMLTAKTADEDVIQGLTLGADDYVAKPFSVAQLVLRVEAVLRRSKKVNSQSSRIRLSPDREIDLLNLSIQIENKSVAFTRREIQVIEYLQKYNDRPVSRDELLAEVWGYDPELAIETRTVDIHIAKIRRKIEVDPKQPQFLVTVRGAGYRLLFDVESSQ
ncbi:response regulator transcription factor [Aliikangiella coralliicola]|uniref:Response regulator transcription factor n=1 Tax=Aliikangiella coralliicola TaxID=2592383 RepID=A0A545UEU6_9GAMM|nr:response regulator transcription factor [Aliikangiella coralliicola]TQV87997.1 response regulator transcription factor [Aliikangiella coralliicola]